MEFQIVVLWRLEIWAIQIRSHQFGFKVHQLTPWFAKCNITLKVHAFLAKDAVVAFNQTMPGPSHITTGVSNAANGSFHDLDTKLKSLQSIMENSDVYF